MENNGPSFKFNDPIGFGEEILDRLFKRYVEERIDIPDADKHPVCPFSFGGECNTAYSDACYDCIHAKEAFQKQLDKAYTDAQAKRGTPRIFCVACGAGKRTPLRKWHNSSICAECWKILQVIGEEEFIKRIKGDEKAMSDQQVEFMKLAKSGKYKIREVALEDIYGEES